MGQGAVDFAIKNESLQETVQPASVVKKRILVVPPADLISPHAKGEWVYWTQRLASEIQTNSPDHPPDDDLSRAMQDTVGAVVMTSGTSRQHAVAGVSRFIQFSANLVFHGDLTQLPS